MRRIRTIAAVLGVALGIAACGEPWPITSARVRSSLVSELSSGFGLNARIDGPITLKLLPRPRIRIGRLTVRDAGGALSADIPAVKGDLDLAALLHGTWRLSSATLIEPTFALDVRPTTVAALRAEPLGRGAGAEGSGLRLKLRNAIVRTAAHGDAPDSLVTDVNATIDRANGTGALSFSGRAIWRSTPVRFHGRLERPADALLGNGSSAAVQLSSPLGDLMAAGQVELRSEPRFTGRIAASTPTLSRLLRAFSTSLPLSRVERVSLAGEGVVGGDDITLSDLQLKLDKASLEGTLAFHDGAGGPALEGTLATDRLNADKLTDAFSDPVKRGALSRERLDSRRLGFDLDLRVSAAEMTIAGIDFGETAASALIHQGRVEITVDEAHAFGGTLKAHASADLHPTGFAAHADLSLASAELGPLSASLSGGEGMTGTLAGKIAVDGRGERVTDALRSLEGQGQLSVANGDFMGMSIAQMLRRFSRKLPVFGGRPGQITRFSSATSSFSIHNGIVTIADGQVIGPGLRMSFGGQSDLPEGKLSITAVAAPTNAEGAPLAEGLQLPFEIHGFLGGPLSMADGTGVFMNRGLNLPSRVPGFDP